MDIGALNALFAIPGHLHFEAGRGGLLKAVVDNPYSRCEIYLQGTHITSFKPHTSNELLWLSDRAVFKAGHAIRGGIPLCWPWFGPQEGKSQHGFARNSAFTLFGTTVNAQGETVLRLGLQDSEATQEHFPYAFTLEYTITVGKRLTLELKTTNNDVQPFELSQALHSYFRVNGIENARIEGLEGTSYFDKLEGTRHVQEGAVVITDAVDRVYDADGACRLHMEMQNIEIQKSGSRSTVVWNPWQEKAAMMDDFDDDGYRYMVCIETVNAGDDTRTLNSGEHHLLIQNIIPFD